MVIDVSAVAVVVGTTVRIGPPAMAASVGGEVAARLELVPAQPVEHEQHDLVGVDRRGRRHPGRAVGARSSSAGTTL